MAGLLEEVAGQVDEARATASARGVMGDGAVMEPAVGEATERADSANMPGSGGGGEAGSSGGGAVSLLLTTSPRQIRPELARVVAQLEHISGRLEKLEGRRGGEEEIEEEEIDDEEKEGGDGGGAGSVARAAVATASGELLALELQVAALRQRLGTVEAHLAGTEAESEAMREGVCGGRGGGGGVGVWVLMYL